MESRWQEFLAACVTLFAVGEWLVLVRVWGGSWFACWGAAQLPEACPDPRCGRGLRWAGGYLGRGAGGTVLSPCCSPSLIPWDHWPESWGAQDPWVRETSSSAAGGSSCRPSCGADSGLSNGVENAPGSLHLSFPSEMVVFSPCGSSESSTCSGSCPCCRLTLCKHTDVASPRCGGDRRELGCFPWLCCWPERWTWTHFAVLHAVLRHVRCYLLCKALCGQSGDVAGINMLCLAGCVFLKSVQGCWYLIWCKKDVLLWAPTFS